MADRNGVYSAVEVKRICMDAGADDAGLVDLERGALTGERAGILHIYPLARTVISLAMTHNRENIQSPARYVANEEFQHTRGKTSALARQILRRLNQHGIRGVVVNQEWPMAMERYPGKLWDVSHKIVAVEAGLGHMGMNRLVLHPKFGSGIQLESILIDGVMDEYDQPLKDNPCIECGLCAAVCPTGAITRGQPFDFMACLTHTYRDNHIGFNNLIEAVVTSKDMDEYRTRFDDRETGFMWQSLMFGMNYRCCYCMAVCPAGEEAGALYRKDKRTHVERIFKPLRDRKERVYVTADSKAETSAGRNANKEVMIVKGLARPSAD